MEVPSKKRLKQLYVATLLLHLSLYLIIPILPIYLVQMLKYKPLRISLIVGTHTIANQIGSVISIFLSDRDHKNMIMPLGSLILGISFLSYPFFIGFQWILLITAIGGIGLGFIQPTIKAGIKESCEEKSSQMAFVVRGIMANTGLLIAGGIVYLLNKQPYRFLFILAGVILILLSLYSFLFVRTNNINHTSPIKLRQYRSILQNKPFLWFSIVHLLLSFSYAQLVFLLPLRGEAVLNNPKQTGLIWIGVSLEVILLQRPIGRIIHKRFHPKTSLLSSFFFFAIGIFLLGIAHRFILLLLSALIFTVGQMIMAPLIDEITGQLSDDRLTGAYYSASHLIGGIGGAVGTYTSGFILDCRLVIKPWFIIAGIILFFMYISWIILRLNRHKGGSSVSA